MATERELIFDCLININIKELWGVYGFGYEAKATIEAYFEGAGVFGTGAFEKLEKGEYDLGLAIDDRNRIVPVIKAFVWDDPYDDPNEYEDYVPGVSKKFYGEPRHLMSKTAMMDFIAEAFTFGYAEKYLKEALYFEDAVEDVYERVYLNNEELACAIWYLAMSEGIEWVPPKLLFDVTPYYRKGEKGIQKLEELIRKHASRRELFGPNLRYEVRVPRSIVPVSSSGRIFLK